MWTFPGKLKRELIVTGHLHDGVILLLRPECFLVFLLYTNFVIPVWFRTKTLIYTRKQRSWRILFVVVKWSHRDEWPIGISFCLFFTFRLSDRSLKSWLNYLIKEGILCLRLFKHCWEPSKMYKIPLLKKGATLAFKIFIVI